MKLAKLKASSRMRTMAGQTLPRQGTGAPYMHKLMQRASGGRCMDMGEVEGKAAPRRMDRPIRMAEKKFGGRAKMKPKSRDDNDGDE